MATFTAGSYVVRDTRTSKLIATLNPPNGRGSIAFTKDDKGLFLVDRTDEISLWDLATGKRMTWLKPGSGFRNISRLLVSPDGTRLVFRHSEGVTMLNLATKEAVWTAKYLHPACEGASFARNGTWLLVPQGQVIVVYDADTGKRLFFNRTNYRDPLCSVAVSPDGKWLALTAPIEQRVDLWKLSDW